MKDRCGREIEVGAIVDVYLDGRFSGNVVEVQDSGLVGTSGQAQPAKLVLMVPIPYKYHPGQPADCYVIRTAEEQKAGQAEKKEERVM